MTAGRDQARFMVGIGPGSYGLPGPARLIGLFSATLRRRAALSAGDAVGGRRAIGRCVRLPGVADAINAAGRQAQRADAG